MALLHIASAILQTQAVDDGPDGPLVWLARVVLFGACAVSLAVYGTRVVRRFNGRAPAPRSPSGPSGADADDASPTRKLFEQAAEARRAEGALGTMGPGDGGDPTAFAGRAQPDDVVGTTPAAPTGTTPPVNEGRAGFFAPSSERSTSRPARSLAELLAGVNMPSDLSPVIDLDGPDPSTDQAFTTNDRAPAEVGQAVGDELERLGYTLRSLNTVEVEATRGKDQLFVRLVPHPAGEARQGRRPYRSLPPGSIVVEFANHAFD